MFKFRLSEVEDLVVSCGASEEAMGWQRLQLQTGAALAWVLYMDFFFLFMSISV